MQWQSRLVMFCIVELRFILAVKVRLVELCRDKLGQSGRVTLRFVALRFVMAVMSSRV